MEEQNRETIQFQHYRRIDGVVEPAPMIRRNRRPELHFPPAATEFPIYTGAEYSPDYLELEEEICQNLNDIERRTWLRIIDKISILDIATEEGVSRQAIYSRIHSMVNKNPYCAIWWRLKNKVNQHK